MSSPDTWVNCDSCHKWRRIPQSLADTLDEDAPWYCKDNPDPVYNECDVPQELTDAEIDAHTNLPVQEEEEPADNGDDDGKEVTLRASKFRKRPPIWQLITKNIYLHRERRQQDEDEIMICQCKPIWATDTTTIGCGENCLNRMLNIECVAKYCPCSDRCTNRAFSRRKYSKLEVKRAGAKGFGLFAAEDVKAGQFIVEYVGEVLEEEEYARRKEFYMSTGQRHYYFMNVGNGEVIDAARRGGLGRFINHSCEPNCETQKWVVKGELAIGLFALEDVPAGTELTFDYNFERYGDKPMKCLCGSKTCRGVIGGSQETAARMNETVVAPEEDEVEPEPIMFTEKEADAALEAILDRAVGLGWEKGFDSKLQSRLKKLAKQKGIDLPLPATGEEEMDDGGGDSDEEIAAAAAAAKATTAAKYKSTAKKKTPRVPRARAADPDWGTPSSTAGPSGKKKSAAKVDSDDDDYGPMPSTKSTPLIPKRAPSLPTPGSRSFFAPVKRSEVDRRLDNLVGPSGRLKDINEKRVIFFMRLFNLCDIGPTVIKKSPSFEAKPAAQPSVKVNDSSKAATGTNVGATLATGDDAKVAEPNKEAVNKEEGEVSGPEEGEAGAAPLLPPPPPPATSAAAPPVEDEGTSKPVNNPESASTKILTARQHARIADLSLLLDVVLKTSGVATARKEFLKCGLLRQLLSTIGRNVGPPYAIILRKVIRVVESLPITADDVYHTRSAHGSFADLLKTLAQHPDYEVRNNARNLLTKWPVTACQRPVVMESWHSSANSARTPMAGGSGGGLPPPSAAGGRNEGGVWDKEYSRDRGTPHHDRGGYPPHPPPSSGGGGRGPSRFALGSRGGGGSSYYSGNGREAPRDYREGGRDPYYSGRDRERDPYSRGYDYDGGRGGGDDSSRKRNRWEPAGGTRDEKYRSPRTDSGMLPPADRERRDEEPAAKYHRSDRGGYSREYGDRQEYNPRERPNDASLPRPTSANAFSDVSRGSDPGNGGGGGYYTNYPAADTAAALPVALPLMPPELSPMTDDDEDNGAVENGATNGARTATGEEAKNHGAGGGAEEDEDDFVINIDVPGVTTATKNGSDEIEDSGSGKSNWESSWDKPNPRFEEFVADVVRRRVGKYEQPDHPNQISRDEAAGLFRTIRKEIIAKEVEAYEERKRNNLVKPIERQKLEARIKDYVRDRVRKFITSKGEGGAN